MRRVGGAAGVLLAMWALDAIVALAPPDSPRFQGIRLDWQALVFAGAVALGTGLLVGPLARVAGLGPGHHGGGVARGQRPRRHGRRGPGARPLAAGGGAGGDDAGAAGRRGRAVQSFWRMRAAPLGFRPGGVVRMSISLPAMIYRKEKIGAFYRQLLERVRALPGVAAAACGINTLSTTTNGTRASTSPARPRTSPARCPPPR